MDLLSIEADFFDICPVPSGNRNHPEGLKYVTINGVGSQDDFQTGMISCFFDH